MLFSVILLIILILINGIFSASELAFLSLDKIDIKNKVKEKDKKAIAIDRILENPSSFLSTIQIGITLAGFLASAFAADTFADYFLVLLPVIYVSESFMRTVLVVFITIVLSYFTLVFGELVPKRIAIHNPYRVASLFVGLIRFVGVAFYPLIGILTLSTEFICKIFHIEEKEDKLTEEDIKKMIFLGKDEGVIEEREKEYLLNVFRFNDIEVRDVMTPRKQVICLNLEDDLRENLSKIRESKFTIFPVYRGDMDHILGILNIKDIVLHYHKDEKFELEKILKKVLVFSENEKIDDVFREMQEKKETICVICSEDKFVGIVTVEDALEEIVGNIYDQYDQIS